MPLYMDMHKVDPGMAPEDLAMAHDQDLDAQGKYRVRYLRYWFDRIAGRVFCLIDAPSMNDAIAVHREAHGLLAERIIEVDAESVEGLLGTVEEAPPWDRRSGQPAPAENPVRTILWTDLVGHTEMMARLGDERGRDVLREHERITREVLKTHAGIEVKTMGDGFLASFASVTKAVESAMALQRAIAEREGERLSIRVGLNAGGPIEEDGDLFGATVILASRIAATAAGGEILVADTVRGLCSGKGFLFAERGEFMAKGFEEPVRVYEVNWRG